MNYLKYPSLKNKKFNSNIKNFKKILCQVWPAEGHQIWPS